MKNIFFNSFFSKYFWSFFKRRENQNFVDKIVQKTRENEKQTEKEILLKLAKSCLSTLELFLKKSKGQSGSRTGDNFDSKKFVYGDEISSFDVVIFGYLKCFLCNGFNDELILLVKNEYPMLNDFCERIEKEIKNLNEIKEEKKNLNLKFDFDKIEEKYQQLKIRNTTERSTTSYVMISFASISIIWFLYLKLKNNLKIVVKEKK